MGFLELFSDPETYVMLATLAGLEIVLGIDNIVFITILCGRLPPEKQPLARRLGLGLALISRLGLLFALGWVMGLKAELFSVFGHPISGRDLILILGGILVIHLFSLMNRINKWMTYKMNRKLMLLLIKVLFKGQDDIHLVYITLYGFDATFLPRPNLW